MNNEKVNYYLLNFYLNFKLKSNLSKFISILINQICLKYIKSLLKALYAV